MANINLPEIEIGKIREIIPKKLINKLEKLGIITVQEVLDIDLESFSRIKGVGKTSLTEFKEFRSDIESNPEKISLYYNANALPQKLPFGDLEENLDIISTFQEILLDFLSLSNNEFYKDAIFLFYGLFNNKVRSRIEIGIIHGKTDERTRQVQKKIRQGLLNLLSGQTIEEPNCYIPIDYIRLIQPFIAQINASEVLTTDLISEIYSQISQKHINKEDLRMMDFLLEIFGVVKCGNVESSFTKTDFYFCDLTIKRKFLKTAEATLKYLKTAIIPVNELDIVIEIRKKLRSTDRNLILKSLSLLSEIEKIEGIDKTLYQVKFEYLSNARDRMFRILSEKGEEMYIDDIVSEINRRLLNTQVLKIHDRHTLAPGLDKRFVPRQKVGYWQLKIWGSINETLETLVKKALIKLDNQSSFEEIMKEVKEAWPKAKETSIRTLIGKNCLQLENENFILPEWKLRYTQLSYKKRKKRIVHSEPEHKVQLREKIISMLKNAPNNSLLASLIIKRISTQNAGYTKVKFYKIFNDEKYFVKKKINSKLVIQLKGQTVSQRVLMENYSWSEVKKTIKREINSVITKAKNPAYTNSSNEILDLLYELIIKVSGEANLDGLEIRLLPTLEKFFLKSSDRNIR